MEQVPERIQLWLQQMEKDPTSGQSEFQVSDRSDRKELLHRAALCYAMAQWGGDACRLFEQVGDFRSAAFYHEREENWHLAAECYVNSKDWHKAARCYLQAGVPVRAAECFWEARQPLQAAWLWAHHAHLFLKAISVVETINTDSELVRWSKELILARCEAGQHLLPAATRRLKNVLLALQEQDLKLQFGMLIDWAFVLSEVLHRPDLRAEIHAATFRMKLPDAREKWMAWALSTLGDSSGIPGLESNNLDPRKKN